VVHTIAEQLRSLLVAWLLLTLPVVCHNQTAVVVLGALTAGHADLHSAAVPTSPHGSHAAAAGAAAHAPQVPDHHPPTPVQYEWCADHSAVHTHGLPEGQDGVSLIGALGLVSTNQLREPWTLLHPAPPNDATATPPSPPPRLLG